MRHKKQGKILGRKKAPRKALFRSLANSLISKNKIQTTEAKAKALRPIVEKYVTKSATNTLATRRQLLADLDDKKTVQKLLDELGPKYRDRKGGYTRVVKLAKPRQGDGAAMAIIEFV